MSIYKKDPEAVLDFKFDWKSKTNGNGSSDWLAADETIVSHVVTVPTGIVLDSSVLENASTTVVAWLSSGTAGTTYEIKCNITTSAGRTDERTMSLIVEER